MQKQDSTGTTKHVWDGQNILLETDGSNIIQVVYTLAAGALWQSDLADAERDDVVLPVRRAGVDDATGQQHGVGDGQLSLRFVREYSSYKRLDDELVQVRRCLGYYYDTDVTRYYVRARMYDPPTGSLLSKDPILSSDSLYNLYRYVGNSPINAIDPSGKLIWWYDQGNRRQGHGPWKFSAGHCWAACYIAAVYGIGNVAAFLEGWTEWIIPSDDADRDIDANWYGAQVGTQWNQNWWLSFGCPKQSPEDYCDDQCQTHA